MHLSVLIVIKTSNFAILSVPISEVQQSFARKHSYLSEVQLISTLNLGTQSNLLILFLIFLLANIYNSLVLLPISNVLYP